MAQSTVNTGSIGGSTWQIVVDLVSQDYAANTSVVRVQGNLYNNSTATSFNNNAISHTVSGSGSWSASSGISVPAKTTKTIIDVSFTIGHDANGYAHVDFTAAFGATGTSGLGGPTSASVGMDLPRIPKRPSPPTGMNVSAITASSMHVWCNAPATDNGAAVDAYETYFLTNNAWPGQGGNVIGSNGTWQLDASALARTTSYYFTSRAHNSQGWSDWAPMGVATTLAVAPAAPGKPVFSNVLPTTLTVSWPASADDGGAVIDSYLVRYWALDGSTGNVDHSVSGSTLSYDAVGLVPGKTYGFIIFAHNSMGYSSQSAETDIQMLAGVWIKIAGVWKMAIPYVKTGGAWKMAVPYIKTGGVWKMTS